MWLYFCWTITIIPFYLCGTPRCSGWVALYQLSPKVTAAPSFLVETCNRLFFLCHYCAHIPLCITLYFDATSFNRPPHMGYGSSPHIPCWQTFSSTVFVSVKEKRWINRATGPWLFLKDIVFLTRRASVNFPVVLICKRCWLVWRKTSSPVDLVLFPS